MHTSLTISHHTTHVPTELEARLAQLRVNPNIGARQKGCTGGGRAGPRTPATDRPTATANHSALGKNADGSDGGEVGADIRRICACECYYTVLGVLKEADDAALKKAYRKKALNLHPDKCSLTGAEAAFKKVSSAYGMTIISMI